MTFSVKGDWHGYIPPKNSMNSGEGAISEASEASEGSGDETGSCKEVIAGVVSSSASSGRRSVGVASGTELSTVLRGSEAVGGTSLATSRDGSRAGTIAGSAVGA